MSDQPIIKKIKPGTFGNCTYCNGIPTVAWISHPRYTDVKVCVSCAREVINELQDSIINHLLGMEVKP